MENERQIFSDEDLARQTQAGSLPAFDELILRYHRRVYAFVIQFCQNPSDAAELTQDTFVRAFQAINSFHPQRPFAAWLFTIARNNCIDHHRSAPPIADAPVPELPDANDPGRQLLQAEDRMGIWDQARRLLPAGQFTALWLKYAEDMSIGEISQVLQKTQTHVKVLLFRGRRVLARELVAPERELPSILPAPMGVALASRKGIA